MKPIIWGRREFSKILRFDFGSVNLVDANDSKYFTTIPISPLEYRQKSPTKAHVRIYKRDGYTIFTIFDDWNCPSVLKVPNEMQIEIEQLKAIAIQQGLTRNAAESEQA